MVLLVISNIVINTQITQSTAHRTNTALPRILMHTRRMINRGAEQQDLTRWLRQMQQRRQGDIVYILDTQGHELLDRRLPESLQQALQDNPASSMDFPPHFRDVSPQAAPLGIRPPALSPPGIIIKDLTLTSGEHFKLIIDNQARQAHWQRWRSLSIGARITIASLLSGIICFFLARYLSRPLQKLRAATHLVASGHYNTPIDSRITNRLDEIGDLGRDFDNMTTRIASTLLSQQRLLRDVSHELRSPLARLQIALGLAQQRSNGLINPELARIELEIERLNELIGQSLSLARLSSQTNIVDKVSINLNKLLENVIANAEYEAADKQSHIVFTELEHCEILGNWDLLHSALENILRNAVHYTKRGTNIEASIIRAHNTTKPSVNIKIRDHGIGVSEADLDKLFEPFFQVDEARTQQNGGYGIGLAIAKRAIDLHHGTIHVGNANDGGLEVSILLPLH